MLLAMATGTGKTKTCIALIYRLLKAQRFRRILFLVDRPPSASRPPMPSRTRAWRTSRPSPTSSASRNWKNSSPTRDTAVHIATVQGMVQRILYPGEDARRRRSTSTTASSSTNATVAICSTGNSPTPNSAFRSFDDYISKYRRVLDYFDAVKIGLTATPALHTTRDLRRRRSTRYSYREAVIDGYLVDHEPPVQINTELSDRRHRLEGGRRGRGLRRRSATRSTSSPRPTRSRSKSRTSTARSSPSPSTGWSASTWPRSSTRRLAAEDPDLLRQRRPRRSGRRPAQRGLRRPVRQRR